MLTNKRREKWGMLLVVISAILFGTMPMLTKIAYQYGSNAFSVAFGRFFIGSMILLLIMKMITKNNILVTRTQMKDLFLLSLFYAIMPILLYSSYTYIDSGLATTLHFTYPAAVVLLLVFFFREHITRKQIISVGICIIGISLLYAPEGGMNPGGILLAVGSGVAYAFYIILLKRSKLTSVPALVASFWVSLLSSIEIGIVALLTGNFVINMKYQAWISEIILAILATVIALVLFQKGVYLCGEIKASLLSAFEPIVGVILGIMVFHESIDRKEMLGIVIVLLAVLLLITPEHIRRPHKSNNE